jgi:carbonic anhydrase
MLRRLQCASSYKDPEQNTREQIKKVRSHPWAKDIPVRGLIFDVNTGRLREVKEQERALPDLRSLFLVHRSDLY